MTAYHDLSSKLARDGFCIIEGFLDNAELSALRKRFSDDSLSRIPAGNFGDAGGFVKESYNDPVMVNLLASPKVQSLFANLGFQDPRLHSFYVSVKPPHAQALPWHSDLFYPYDKPEPAELFAIYYLQDTSPENGCLRVVPGSHLWPHEKRKQQSGDDGGRRADELSVEIAAGNLFIGDRRILHATHANQSEAWRTCITIAYAPDFRSLDEAIQAFIVGNSCLPPQGWWNSDIAIDSRLSPILPRYEGNTKPIKAV